MVLGFIANAAGLALLAVEVSDMLGGKEASRDSTIVQMVVGSGDDTMGGTVPHISLWTEKGKRLGQYNPHGKKKDAGTGHTVAVDHFSEQNEASAGYIMLSNLKNNAICISAIYITDDHVSTAWFGDYGKKCGMSWGLSNEEIGPDRIKPPCVWLDGDNTNDINAQAMSFHIKDMVGSYDRKIQYENAPETMCGSTARFSYWGDLLPDSWIPFFSPPLEYEEDSQSLGLGKDKDMFRVLDRSKKINKGVQLYRAGNVGIPKQEEYDWLGEHCEKENSWGKSYCPEKPVPKRELGTNNHPRIKMEIKANMETRSKRDAKTIVKRRPYRRGVSDRLIITSHKEHSAKELCESNTSYGPDTASTTERLFCDMETKVLYPFCEEKTEEVCFDVDSRSLRLANGGKIRQGRSEAPKVYNAFDVWGESMLL